MLRETAIDSDELFHDINPSLILIDFGVSIDMRLLAGNAKFYFKFEKAENLIIEMLENKPWNYQIDYFGVANIVHTILYGGYMKVVKNNGKYEPSGKPKRWWNVKLWTSFFQEFLNIQDCHSLPDLVKTRKLFESFLFDKYRGRFQSVVSDLKNTLYRK